MRIGGLGGTTVKAALCAEDVRAAAEGQPSDRTGNSRPESEYENAGALAVQGALAVR